MKGKKFGKSFLCLILIVTLGSLPMTLRKPPIKDWIIVYLFNAVTNGIIDNILTTLDIVKYPVRIFSKLFEISVVFDFVIYPFITILYNKWTYNDRWFSIFYKIFLLAIPMLIIELWAEKKTSLIKWKKGWSWYHTYLSIVLKSIITRTCIGIVRKVEKGQRKNNKDNGNSKTLELI